MSVKLNTNHCCVCRNMCVVRRFGFWNELYCNAHGLKVKAMIKKKLHLLNPQLYNWIFPNRQYVLQFFDPHYFGLIFDSDYVMPSFRKINQAVFKQQVGRLKIKHCQNCDQLIQSPRRGCVLYMCSRCGLAEKRTIFRYKRNVESLLYLVNNFKNVHKYLRKTIVDEFLNQEI